MNNLKNRDSLIFELKKSPFYVDLRLLREFSALSEVPPDTLCLTLENSTLDDTSLGLLPSLPSIRCLDLDSTNVTDLAAAFISRFSTLEELWIEDTGFTDSGILELVRKLPKLRYISAFDCDLTDELLDRVLSINPEVSVSYDSLTTSSS